MKTKQTNLLFISLFFLAGISTVVSAAEESLQKIREEEIARSVLNKKVQRDDLEKWALAAEMGIKLEVAEKTGSFVIKKFLEELETASQEDKNTLFLRYSLKGILPMVQRLVEARADLSAKSDDGWPALTLASQNNNEEVLKYLVGQEG